MLHMEHYLEAADAAISAAMELRKRPDGIHKRLRYHDEESVRDDLKKKDKKTFRVLPDAVVIFDDNSPTVLRQWIVRTRGRYRIRISGYAYQAAGRPVWLKLYATDFKTQRLLAYFDMPADTPRLMEVVTTLEAGQLLNLSPFDTNYDDQGRRSGFWGIGAETYPGRGIAIEWVEVEGPLVECWPPPSVGRLFGDLPVKPLAPARKAGPGRQARIYAIAPGNPRSAAEKVLREFASRAFRRPVTSAEVERFVKLAHTRARRRPELRGRNVRGLPRRDRIATVPVPRRVSRASRRLGAGVPAVVFPLEYAAGRRSAEARGQRHPAPTPNPPRPGRKDAGFPQGPGVRRELRRPVARSEADRFHPARPEAVPGIRRHPESGHDRRNACVLRADAARRFEAEATSFIPTF